MKTTTIDLIEQNIAWLESQYQEKQKHLQAFRDAILNVESEC